MNGGPAKGSGVMEVDDDTIDELAEWMVDQTATEGEGQDSASWVRRREKLAAASKAKARSLLLVKKKPHFKK